MLFGDFSFDPRDLPDNIFKYIIQSNDFTLIEEFSPFNPNNLDSPYLIDLAWDALDPKATKIQLSDIVNSINLSVLLASIVVTLIYVSRRYIWIVMAFIITFLNYIIKLLVNGGQGRLDSEYTARMLSHAIAQYARVQAENIERREGRHTEATAERREFAKMKATWAERERAAEKRRRRRSRRNADDEPSTEPPSSSSSSSSGDESDRPGPSKLSKGKAPVRNPRAAPVNLGAGPSGIRRATQPPAATGDETTAVRGPRAAPVNIGAGPSGTRRAAQSPAATGIETTAVPTQKPPIVPMASTGTQMDSEKSESPVELPPQPPRYVKVPPGLGIPTDRNITVEELEEHLTKLAVRVKAEKADERQRLEKLQDDLSKKSFEVLREMRAKTEANVRLRQMQQTAKKELEETQKRFEKEAADRAAERQPEMDRKAEAERQAFSAEMKKEQAKLEEMKKEQAELEEMRKAHNAREKRFADEEARLKRLEQRIAAIQDEKEKQLEAERLRMDEQLKAEKLKMDETVAEMKRRLELQDRSLKNAQEVEAKMGRVQKEVAQREAAMRQEMENLVLAAQNAARIKLEEQLQQRDLRDKEMQAEAIRQIEYLQQQTKKRDAEARDAIEKAEKAEKAEALEIKRREYLELALQQERAGKGEDFRKSQWSRDMLRELGVKEDVDVGETLAAQEAFLLEAARRDAERREKENQEALLKYKALQDEATKRAGELFLQKIAQQKEEAQKAEKERQAEEERQRLAAQQAEAERQRLAAQNAEEERKAEEARQWLAAQKNAEAERQRLAAQNAEEERKAEEARQWLAAQQNAEAERQRLAAQKAEADRKAEQERRADAERQRLAAQQAEAERQRLAAQKAEADRKAEQERQAEAERQRLEAQQKAEAERQRLEAQQKAEAERQRLVAQQKAEADRKAEQERQAEAERQRLVAQKAEADRKAQEDRLMAEAAALARKRETEQISSDEDEEVSENKDDIYGSPTRYGDEPPPQDAPTAPSPPDSPLSRLSMSPEPEPQPARELSLREDLERNKQERIANRPIARPRGSLSKKLSGKGIPPPGLPPPPGKDVFALSQAIADPFKRASLPAHLQPVLPLDRNTSASRGQGRAPSFPPFLNPPPQLTKDQQTSDFKSQQQNNFGFGQQGQQGFKFGQQAPPGPTQPESQEDVNMEQGQGRAPSFPPFVNPPPQLTKDQQTSDFKSQQQNNFGFGQQGQQGFRFGQQAPPGPTQPESQEDVNMEQAPPDPIPSTTQQVDQDVAMDQAPDPNPSTTQQADQDVAMGQAPVETQPAPTTQQADQDVAMGQAPVETQPAPTTQQADQDVAMGQAPVETQPAPAPVANPEQAGGAYRLAPVNEGVVMNLFSGAPPPSPVRESDASGSRRNPRHDPLRRRSRR
ncbi:hypothetical protein DFH27DRAFT_631650 [Peziza echinospora]|nr:hypothetical protein DFH27DRAFT_631650 [Peziza echinospora]